MAAVIGTGIASSRRQDGSLHQRFEHAVRAILVELDIDARLADR